MPASAVCSSAEPEQTIPTSIEPARFGDELRRVKHYIATNNIYGVDLNETAVELGQLSLWLGSIHRLLVQEGENGGRDIYRSGATPWFGLRLRCGNSLIGGGHNPPTVVGSGPNCANSTAGPTDGRLVLFGSCGMGAVGQQ